METDPNSTAVAVVAAPDPSLPAETNPNSTAAAVAAAPDPSLPALPAAAAASVAAAAPDPSPPATSNIMSDERMVAAKERFHELLEEKDSKKKERKTKLLSDQEYDEICNVLKGWKVRAKHSSAER
jgi:hypothetical protein